MNRRLRMIVPAASAAAACLALVALVGRSPAASGAGGPDLASAAPAPARPAAVSAPAPAPDPVPVAAVEPDRTPGPDPRPAGPTPAAAREGGPLESMTDAGLARVLGGGGDAERRHAAALLLLDRQSTEAVGPARRILAGEEETLLRRLAAHLVGALGGAGDAVALESAALGDPDWVVRYNSAYHLAADGSPRGLEVLESIRRDGPLALRSLALTGLAEHGDDSSRPLFQDLLLEGGSFERRMALEYVRRRGDLQSLALVEAVLDDELDPDVVDLARRVHEELVGRSVGS